MGDLIMTGPALRALKETFSAKITVLTSSMAAGIAAFMPEIDEVIVCDLPWVKNQSTPDPSRFYHTIEKLKAARFDAAVIFTVYSQSPLPTVMLAYLACIPNRLAYCRENPYQLLTDWVPDKEPYSEIKHQVQRDLDLVATVGAVTGNDALRLKIDKAVHKLVAHKLQQTGIDTDRPWLIFHPGVSELKRQYPESRWTTAGKKVIGELGYQLVITGSAAEKQLTEDLQTAIGGDSYATGGLFPLEEFIALIQLAAAVVAVNTGTIHIAAAVQTPCLVLYALTNPQHTPWKTPHMLLPFSIPETLQSKNEIIRFVHQALYRDPVSLPDDERVLSAIKKIIGSRPLKKIINGFT